MNLKKCENGHFYDADTYSACPHCGEGSIIASGDDVKTLEKGKVPEDEEMTVAYDSYEDIPTKPDQGNSATLYDDQPTISYMGEGWQELAVQKPVVGWMVCTEGNARGSSFVLRAGGNSIGREWGNDVCLADEKTVSRKRHAMVIYEPRQNIFLAQPGDTRELTYLNGNVVLTPVVVKKNDVLQVGEVSLMLIPCCDDKFTWKEKTDD